MVEREQFTPIKSAESEKKMAEYNDYAIKKIKSLTEHNYFEIIRTADKDMALNKDPFAKGFYLSKQDKLNEAYGEILIAYRKLKGKWLSYLATRKFESVVQAKTEKTKIPGNEILEDILSSEIIDVYNAMLLLRGWKDRAENSIKTARNHTYGEREREEGGHVDEDTEPRN
jgi:hypothetical protein